MKLGIGLQLIKISKDEFIKILDEYHEHISYIYYSSLMDYKFYARKILTNKEMDIFNSVNPQDQYDILEYARSKYNIKTELAVNSYTCKDDNDFVEMFKVEIQRHKPDKCVTYNRLVDKLYEIDRGISYELTFNEGLISESSVDSISNKFSSIVIGGRFIRDERMMRKIVSSDRIPTILINNSCAHNCGYCGRCDCLKVFNYNLGVCGNDINIPFAIQTLLPWEIYDNPKIYKSDYYYKLSTRLCDYGELKYLLDSYINNKNDVVGYSQFHALCPLRHFEKYYNDINLTNVKSLKDEIWIRIKQLHKDLILI